MNQALQGKNSDMNMKLDELKDIKNIDQFLTPFGLTSMIKNGGSLPIDKIIESLQKGHFIDYNSVIDMAKNLKSFDSTKQSKIESILKPQNENISNNTLSDIMQTLKQQHFNQQQNYQNDNVKYSNHKSYDNHSINGVRQSQDDGDDNDIEQQVNGKLVEKDGDDYDERYIDNEDDIESEGYSNTDTCIFSMKSSLDKNLNFLDNVKENLDQICNNNNLKRKNTKKRWWTPEEVITYLLFY